VLGVVGEAAVRTGRPPPAVYVPSRPPAITSGSIACTMPCRSGMPRPGPSFGTPGRSCVLRPTPWPCEAVLDAVARRAARTADGAGRVAHAVADDGGDARVERSSAVRISRWSSGCAGPAVE
jgi:hypothetical protein